MRKILTAVLVGMLIAALGGAPLALSQDIRSNEEPVQANPGTLAFFPPPKPWVPIINFPGITDNSFTASLSIHMASVIHCTNVGKRAVNIAVELYNYDGSYITAIGAPLGLQMDPGRTITFGTSGTAGFTLDSLPEFGLATKINQGVARVLINNKKGKKSIICNGMIVDSTNNPPTFGIALAPY